MPGFKSTVNLRLIQQQKYIPLKNFKTITSDILIDSKVAPSISQGKLNHNTNTLVGKDVPIQHTKQPKNDVKIEISIKAQRSMAKLKEAQTLPAMISLKTEGGSRTNVDLICVIDVSGSMSG